MQMKVNIPLGEKRSIAAEWKVFSEKIFSGQKPSTIQCEETRKAFYAGFYSCLASCLNIAEESDERGIEILESLRIECETFFLTEVQNYMEKRN